MSTMGSFFDIFRLSKRIETPVEEPIVVEAPVIPPVEVPKEPSEMEKAIFATLKQQGEQNAAIMAKFIQYITPQPIQPMEEEPPQICSYKSKQNVQCELLAGYNEWSACDKHVITFKETHRKKIFRKRKQDILDKQNQIIELTQENSIMEINLASELQMANQEVRIRQQQQEITKKRRMMIETVVPPTNRSKPNGRNPKPKETYKDDNIDDDDGDVVVIEQPPVAAKPVAKPAAKPAAKVAAKPAPKPRVAKEVAKVAIQVATAPKVTFTEIGRPLDILRGEYDVAAEALQKQAEALAEKH